MAAHSPQHRRLALALVLVPVALMAFIALVVWGLSGGEPASPETDETVSMVAEVAPRVAEAPSPKPRRPLAVRPGGLPGGPSAPPAFKGTEVKEAVFADGPIHRFTERTYDPPYRLKDFERMPKADTLETPEEALASLTSAMSRVDWDWWIQQWDRPSRRRLARLLKMQGIGKERFIEIWAAVAKGERFVATRRIDMPGYVIIYSRRETADDSEMEARSPLALKRDASGRWWLTNELKDHPVYSYGMQGVRDGVEVRTVR